MSFQSIKTYMHRLDEITSTNEETLKRQIRLKDNLIRRRVEMEVQKEAEDNLSNYDEMVFDQEIPNPN